MTDSRKKTKQLCHFRIIIYTEILWIFPTLNVEILSILNQQSHRNIFNIFSNVKVSTFTIKENKSVSVKFTKRSNFDMVAKVDKPN